MLADPRTAEMARLILERIPGEPANEALRRAPAAVSGKLRVGIINSLAVRGDPRAVPALRSLAGQSGQDAEAAIAALGNIATAEAVRALKAAAAGAGAERRTAIGEALLPAYICREALALARSSIADEDVKQVRGSRTI
jgi:HEAT repeat protein